MEEQKDVVLEKRAMGAGCRMKSRGCIFEVLMIWGQSANGARPKRAALVYIGRAIPVRLGVALGVLDCVDSLLCELHR
jgi:hypothetical protein